MRLTPRPRRMPAALSLLLLPLLAPAAAAQEAAAPAASAPADAVPPEGAKPVAVFPEFTHEFGEVTRGQKLHHIFVVKNEGKVDLQILNVAPT